LHTEYQLPWLVGSVLKVSLVVQDMWVLVLGSTALCGHTNFVVGLKLGCENNLAYFMGQEGARKLRGMARFH
jgi:hypothetical protein